MGTLVIKGHPTRGKEVIEILEMLGGNNIKEHCGESNLLYTIRERDNVIIAIYHNSDISQIYTLEEFLEKFPYKVGDKVNYIKYNDGYPSVYTIQGMRWTGVTIKYLLDSSGFSALTKDLQPYKEEVMEEKKLNSNASFLDCSMVEKIELALGDTHEVVVEDGKTFVVRKKPQYPNTYEECCKVLDWNPLVYDRTGYKFDLLCKLQVLLVCRDAYWKIAGDWKPDWKNTEQDKYVIEYIKGEVVTHGYPWNETNHFLSFPTDEMRDAFYENFKEWIEQCKELL